MYTAEEGGRFGLPRLEVSVGSGPAVNMQQEAAIDTFCTHCQHRAEDFAFSMGPRHWGPCYGQQHTFTQDFICFPHVTVYVHVCESMGLWHVY